MARRKVTMLEAFQRSARESAERAAAERRRVIAEREKEIRRAGTARTAQEFSSRLSRRAGGSMGSLLAGIRGAPAARFEDGAEAASLEVQEPLELRSGAPSADAPDIYSVSPAAAAEPAIEARNGPAPPTFDRSVQAELPSVSQASVGLAPALTQKAVSPQAEASEMAPVEEALEADASPESSPGASAEDVEDAIAALEAEVFELPMSPLTFGLLGLAAAVAVFIIGYSAGQSGEPGSGDSSSARPSLASYPSLHGSESRVSSAAADSGRPSPEESSSAARETSQGGAALPGTVLRPSADEPAVPELTPEDRTFRSEAMRFTILTVTYPGTEAHAKLAMETYDYLYSEGFPVIHPIEKDSRIFLFVGAAKSMGELEGLRQELKDLRSSQGSDVRPFRSAYLVNTDPYR